jgi:Leucine-rich repeat (LRR) protein
MFIFTVSDPVDYKLKIDATDLSKDHSLQTTLRINFEPFNHIFDGMGEAFKNLEKLYIASQQIKFITRSNFKHLENLKQLYLNDNEIQHLPEHVFSDLTNLQNLFIDSNRIEELPSKIFMNLKNIQLIDLSNNRIKHFPSDLLSGNLQLHIFSSNGNPGNTSNIDTSKIPNVKF